MTTQMKETQLLSLSVIAKCFKSLLAFCLWWHLFSPDAIGLTKLKNSHCILNRDATQATPALENQL